MARSALGCILIRSRVNLAVNGSRVRVSWREYAGTPTSDPTTGARTGTTEEQWLDLPAHLHFSDTGLQAVQLHNEIETGDCIAVFAADAPFDQAGRLTATAAAVPDSVRFALLDAKGIPVPGEVFVAKPLGKALAQMWDARLGGHALHRTLLLRKAT